MNIEDNKFINRLFQRIIFFSNQMFNSMGKLLLLVFAYSYIKNKAIDFVKIVENNFEIILIIIFILSIEKTYKKHP